MNKHTQKLSIGTYAMFFALLIIAAIAPLNAIAQTTSDINDIATGLIKSNKDLPGLISGLSYLAGVLLAVLGIFKTIDHVANPTQTPIRMPIIRFLIGGALFALPTVVEASLTTIIGDTTQSDMDGFDFANTLSGATGIIGVVSSVLSLDYNMNVIYYMIMESTDKIPGLVTGVGYLLALLTIVSALFKTRDHVDDPTRVPLKDVVIRYLIGGALLGLPVIYESMYNMMNASGLGVGLGVASMVSTLFGSSAYSVLAGGSVTNCIFGSSIINNISSLLGGGSEATLGDLICSFANSNAVLPFMLSFIAYLIGLVYGIWGLVKIRDHVTNPQQTSLWDCISRLLAGGAFFALPFVAYTINESITIYGFASNFLALDVTGYVHNSNMGCSSGTHGLDTALACLMQDLLGPVHYAVQFFCYVAGTIFIMIGISRVIKSSQEGAKGPGGIGTLSTFITGALLMSVTTLLGVITQSIFSDGDVATKVKFAYDTTSSLSQDELIATYRVISAVIKFMIIIGLISFVRGMFIMRSLAEGNQQASAMAAITHIVGGALAVNIGPLLNAVQTTLGIDGYGLTFY